MQNGNSGLNQIPEYLIGQFGLPISWPDELSEMQKQLESIQRLANTQSGEDALFHPNTETPMESRFGAEALKMGRFRLAIGTIMKILISILGFTLLAPILPGQETQDAQDSADTSAAQAAIKKVQNSSKAATPATASPSGSPSTPPSPTLIPSCSLSWSSWWDQLAAERQAVLLQPGAVDRMIQMGGGLEAIATDEKLRSEENDALIFRQSQSQGKVPPGMTSQEYTAFRRGLIDIYHCRTGDRETSTTRLAGITNCQEAAYFRDHQLVKEFDVAMSRYNIFKDGKLQQEKIGIESQKLMDKEWWGGKTAVQVEIEIKFYAQLFNDTVGWLAPDEYFERLYGKTAVHGLKLVQHDAIAIDAMKREIEEDAKKAALDTLRDYVKDVMKQVGSFAGIYYDLEQHNIDRASLAQAEATIQKVVANIERTMNQYDSRMRESQARANAIADDVAAIDQACAPASVAIPPR